MPGGELIPAPGRARSRRAGLAPTTRLALGSVLALCLALATPAAAQERWARVLYVNDGDTLTVSLEGRRELVRLLGIDAPETARSPKLDRAARRAGRGPAEEAQLGERARARLAELAPPGARLGLRRDPQAPARDPHGRLLAYARLADGRQLNAVMLEEGWAVVFQRCACQELAAFRALERRARARGVGQWTTPRPWAEPRP